MGTVWSTLPSLCITTQLSNSYLSPFCSFFTCIVINLSLSGETSMLTNPSSSSPVNSWISIIFGIQKVWFCRAKRGPAERKPLTTASLPSSGAEIHTADDDVFRLDISEHTGKGGCHRRFRGSRGCTSRQFDRAGLGLEAASRFLLGSLEWQRLSCSHKDTGARPCSKRRFYIEVG